jgi:hypothetical protein
MALQMLPMMELLAGLVLLEQHGLHVRTGMSVPKNVAFLAFSLAHRLHRDGQFIFCFVFLSRFLMAASLWHIQLLFSIIPVYSSATVRLKIPKY